MECKHPEVRGAFTSQSKAWNLREKKNINEGKTCIIPLMQWLNNVSVSLLAPAHYLSLQKQFYSIDAIHLFCGHFSNISKLRNFHMKMLIQEPGQTEHD